MALVARASNTVRNKNLIIVVMCLVFLGWFAYDGWHTYPTNNDRLIAVLKTDTLKRGLLTPEERTFIDSWKGWSSETGESRKQMDALILSIKSRISVEGWKEVFDIAIQRDIVYGLILVAGASLWWFIRCQQRRAIAEEKTVSPAPGVVIPWEKIKLVDNTRWKSTGIVDITYEDERGNMQRARFDDYVLDREPLLAILDQLGEKAVHAEFIPKEEPARSHGPGQGEDGEDSPPPAAA